MAEVRLTRRGSEVPLELTEYVWDGRITRVGINVIVGPSGAGKSTLAAMLTAKWTTGALTGKPEHVLMLMSEDIAATTVARVIAHGGNLDLVHLPPTRRVVVPRDLDKLRRSVGETGARIVIPDRPRPPPIAASG